MSKKCTLCGTILETTDNIFSLICPKCKQKYEYGEGYIIQLTEKQINLLLKNI